MRFHLSAMFATCVILGVLASPFGIASADEAAKPNVVIIFVDDMGYADIGCFGSQKNRTPNIDRMADEGMRLTSFYSACSVCSPSRAALMTGCYPKRVDLHCDHAGLCVLFPSGKKGLNPDEITIADLLKTQGYKTACIGKWHLGDQPEFLPTKQGFDYYYGIPYSNDMGGNGKGSRPPLPLMRDEAVFEAPCDQDTVTKRYTEEAVKFIRECKGEPFFLYLPHTMVHVPLHVADEFRGKSAHGIYSDAVEEIDWSTGQLLDTLEELGIEDDTFILFTSDNGGTGRSENQPLRGHKGQTYEGGMREPCVAWWPGHIPAGSTCDELCGTIDMLPTVAAMAGTVAPQDRIIDGRDIRPLLFGEEGAVTPHEAYYYYQVDQLQAVRSGKWKLFLPQDLKRINWRKPEENTPAELYDLEADISESNNVAADHPEVIARLTELADKMRQDIGDVDIEGENTRPAGYVEEATPRVLETE